MIIPEKISSLISDKTYRTDEIGMSQSSILIFDEKVLKIGIHSEESDNECRMMKYLYGKLPVPVIYAYETADGKSYLLMSKCEGRMACDDEYMRHPSVQCRMLADGLKKLWSIDISDCPSNMSLPYKLKQAEYNVVNGLVDLNNVEPDTFGEGGFNEVAVSEHAGGGTGFIPRRLLSAECIRHERTGIRIYRFRQDGNCRQVV